MQRSHPSDSLTNWSSSRTTTLGILCLVFWSALVCAQDSPGRFELGGNFTATHFGTAAIGPGVEGDFNLGRHLALDGAFIWMPKSFFQGHTTMGLFGVKAGARTQHFGFFGKVRPGFMAFSNALREETLTFGSGGITIDTSLRFASLTQRALDMGGVLEYYPARHWALRWDFGDTVLFQEAGPKLTLINTGSPPVNLVATAPGRTSNNFQFSTGVHYRFGK
jgi:hypothetical protein